MVECLFSCWRPQKSLFGLCGLGEWQCYLTEVPSVKVGETKKTLQLLLGREHWALQYGFDFCGICSQSALFNDKVQERDSGDMKLTLLRFAKKQILQQTAQHQPHLLDMLCSGSGENQDIIKINKQEVVQKIFYQCLEHSRSIGEPKLHY